MLARPSKRERRRALSHRCCAAAPFARLGAARSRSPPALDAFLRCGKDDVVAFSCKGRGSCPSCGARRMADTAPWLVDCVIPDETAVRQWVLSLPAACRPSGSRG